MSLLRRPATRQPSELMGAVPALQPCPSLWDRDLSAVGSFLERPHPHGTSLLEASFLPKGVSPRAKPNRSSLFCKQGRAFAAPTAPPSSRTGAHRRFREHLIGASDCSLVASGA